MKTAAERYADLLAGGIITDARGTVDDLGRYKLIIDVTGFGIDKYRWEDIDDIREEMDEETQAAFAAARGIIIHTDSQGCTDYDLYDTEAAAREAWATIEAQFDEYDRLERKQCGEIVECAACGNDIDLECDDVVMFQTRRYCTTCHTLDAATAVVNADDAPAAYRVQCRARNGRTAIVWTDADYREAHNVAESLRNGDYMLAPSTYGMEAAPARVEPSDHA